MAYAPDPRRRSLFAGTPPLPAPFLTPRPERRRVDARWVEGGSFRTSHDREVNVQVIVRCRPLTDEEQRLNVANVISCNEYKKEVIISQSAAYKQVDKIFTFDKVFGPDVQQKSMYDQAISPIVNDVLEGFNCTIFAYGQTGTGKTYTMEGGMKNKGGELPVDAGVIPRAVRQLFDTLENQKADYDMKVTFLEIYNEEITDLLAPEDYSRYLDDRQKKLISLMEDGRGGVIVRGLEEVVVHSANEIYSILERVSLKRRTSETLLNKHSSRSHSIFSITINVKESTTVNEEVIKSGKLNLVDLAGSENISITGVREGRAREAGEINKSLLTLGRVINALVEYSSHTPYRDSKLTRLLRDSLGGKTKTCIIATVSPAAYCLEETLSTLDLAYQAKNIKNKPEVNQKLFKSILLKDLHLEIEKLKQDVRAAREKNGVYMPYERFVQNEAEKKATAEKIEQLECHLDHREKDIKRMHEIHFEEQKRNLDLENQVNELKFDLENTNRALQDLQENYHRATLELQEKDSIISNLQSSENLIIERAKDLRGGLQAASDDVSLLFTKLDCKNRIEAGNHEILLSFRCQLDESLTSLQKSVEESVSNQHQQLRRMQENLGSFIARKFEANKNLESRIDNMRKIYDSGVMAIKGLACALQKNASSDLENTKLTMSAQKINIENFLVTAVSEAEHVLEDIQSSLSEQKHLMSICARQQQEGLHKNLMTTQVISRSIVDFLHDLYSLSNKVIATTQEKHKDMTQQFEAFEKTFQEESIKEEKVTLEKFAKILAILQTKKTNMISEALKNMKNKSIDENNLLHEEMLKMQHISTKAEACWSSYIEKVEYQFQEETSSTADTSAAMAKNLDKCTNKVNQSKRQWESAQVFVNHHNKSFTTEIESAAEKQFHENKTLLEDFTVSSSATEADFDVGILGLLTATEDSITMDHKYKEDTEKISSVCFDLMKELQNNHSERVEEMRNRAENCLAKEYLLDEPTSAVPERRAITVPRLASIERLRKTSDLNLSLSNKTSEGHAEAKQSSTLSEVARSPLAPLN